MNINAGVPAWIGREETDLAWKRQRNDDERLKQDAARIALAQRQQQLNENVQAANLISRGLENQIGQLKLKQQTEGLAEITQLTQATADNPDALFSVQATTPLGMDWLSKARATRATSVAGQADLSDRAAFAKNWASLTEEGRTAVLSAAEANSFAELMDDKGAINWVARQEMAAQTKAREAQLQAQKLALETAKQEAMKNREMSVADLKGDIGMQQLRAKLDNALIIQDKKSETALELADKRSKIDVNKSGLNRDRLKGAWRIRQSAIEKRYDRAVKSGDNTSALRALRDLNGLADEVESTDFNALESESEPTPQPSKVFEWKNGGLVPK